MKTPKLINVSRESVILDLKIQDIEIRIQQAEKIPAILKLQERVSSTPEPIPPTEVTPDFFVRPDKYKTPHIGIWRRWLEAKGKGITFSLNGVISTLCLSCGIPVPCSESDKTRIGSRGKFSHDMGRGNWVVVGAIVYWDEDVEIQNPYTFEVEETEVKVFRLVTVTGLGCSGCRREYLKLAAESISVNRVREAEYHNRLKEIGKIRELYLTATRGSGQEPNQGILDTFTIPEPKRVTPYILINPKEIAPETTLKYWREKADKLEPVALVSPPVPTQITPSPMGFLVECPDCTVKVLDYKTHKCRPSLKKQKSDYDDSRFSLLNPNRFQI